MSPEVKRPVIALDLGGTKLLAALVSASGQVTARELFPTRAQEGPESVINRLFMAIDSLLKLRNLSSSEIDSISIAAAGPINLEKGMVTASPNLPGWHNIPLRDRVQDKFGVKTFLVHDATAGALGEYRFGAGKGAQNLIYIAVGTGIGGGIILNGKVHDGAVGSAGEVGHMTIDVHGQKDTCGNVGCLETLASGTAIAREAKRRIHGGEKSALMVMVKGKIDDITAEKVGLAAQGGDPLARDVIRNAAVYLGIGLVNLVNVLNPDTIVVGGSVAKLGEPWLDTARQVVKERAFPVAVSAVRIVLGKLGDEAAVLGAAASAFEHNS